MTVRASRTEVVIDTSALIAVLTAEPARERLIARTQGAELLAPGSVHWETGNALSHLAILARELGVPCVVGQTGARERFPSGTALIIDGTTGEVAPVEERGR